MDGDFFIRIGKIQPDTIGVELEQFPDVLFICGIPDCTEPEHIIEKTLERIWPKDVFFDRLSFGPDSKTSRQLRIVNVTRGFIGSDKSVATGRGEKIIFERNGTVLIVCSKNPDISKVNNFLKMTGAIS